VQPGLLTEAELQRLDGMELGPVLAELAATSSRHRDAAAKRARGDGFLGVSFEQRSQKWKSKLVRNGTFIVGKRYDTAEEAPGHVMLQPGSMTTGALVANLKMQSRAQTALWREHERASG
jgi:hypothetical protein